MSKIVGPLKFDYANVVGTLPQLEINPYSWTKVMSISYNYLKNMIMITKLYLVYVWSPESGSVSCCLCSYGNSNTFVGD